MINDAPPIADEMLHVLDGITLPVGAVNVPDDQILAHVRSAIRRPYPQVWPQAVNRDRIALVGSGPSLVDTEGELVALLREGAKLVTMNGAYGWCLARNLVPHAQIIMDARPSNARFLEPAIPSCRYLLASQCAPETWDAVAGRPHVWIFHAATGDSPLRDLLNAHYLGQWFGVGGGVTVATRAIGLLRALGYLRFDLFGIDSCFLGGAHHAFPQQENEQDERFAFIVQPSGHPDLARTFECAPWHVKQFEDFLQLIRLNSDAFLLAVHGAGLLAYALEASADLEYRKADVPQTAVIHEGAAHGSSRI